MENILNNNESLKNNINIDRKKSNEHYLDKSRLVITNNTVYEYDMDCISKNKSCLLCRQIPIM